MTLSHLCTAKWVGDRFDRSILSLTFDLDPLILFWFLELEKQVQVRNWYKTRKSTTKKSRSNFDLDWRKMEVPRIHVDLLTLAQKVKQS